MDDKAVGENPLQLSTSIDFFLPISNEPIWYTPPSPLNTNMWIQNQQNRIVKGRQRTERIYLHYFSLEFRDFDKACQLIHPFIDFIEVTLFVHNPSNLLSEKCPNRYCLITVQENTWPLCVGVVILWSMSFLLQNVLMCVRINTMWSCRRLNTLSLDTHFQIPGSWSSFDNWISVNLQRSVKSLLGSSSECIYSFVQLNHNRVWNFFSVPISHTLFFMDEIYETWPRHFESQGLLWG